MTTIDPNYRPDNTYEFITKNFPWESAEQHKGFLNLVQYLKKYYPEGWDPQLLIASYFIKKDHESNEWWSGIFGDRVSELTDQIQLLQQDILDLKTQLAEIRKT